VLSAREDPLSIQRAFRARVHAYLALEDDSSEAIKALSRIFDGHLYASASVMRRLLESLATNQIEPARSDVKALSDRALQVFSLIGRGFGASRLATELHLSVKTIEMYQAHLKQKVGLQRDRAQRESCALDAEFDAPKHAIEETDQNRSLIFTRRFEVIPARSSLQCLRLGRWQADTSI